VRLVVDQKEERMSSIKVGVNGYGVIGKRVDAVTLQPIWSSSAWPTRPPTIA
jgi:hypothetical protein